MSIELIGAISSVVFNIIAVVLVWAIKQQVHEAVAPIILKVNELNSSLQAFQASAQKDISQSHTDIMAHICNEYPHPQQEERLRDRYVTRTEVDHLLAPIHEKLRERHGHQSRDNN